jgi:hypothetical protein
VSIPEATIKNQKMAEIKSHGRKWIGTLNTSGAIAAVLSRQVEM